ncbi:MAG: hypothetical protein GDA42_13115 [Ekhidna sp.]|nr:hypothetical protein [Ekhidna sp.]MBC6411366.1 hypothetical protein [Ekhidna sp.]
MEMGSYNLAYTNPVLEIQHAESSSNTSLWGFSSFLLYEFKPNTFIGLVLENPATKTGITSYDLAVSKDFNLNSNGRPIEISPGLRVGYQLITQLINTYKTESDYSINGKSFDSGKINVFLTQKHIHLHPNLTFSIEKSHRLNFFTSINYSFSFNRQIGLTFVEKDKFLFRKKQFLRNGDEGLTINGNDNDILNSGINVNAGIFFHF